MRKAAIGILASVAVVCASSAQPQAVRKPSQPVLAGPAVDATAHDTIVRRASDGTIVRPEMPPEVAALKLLELPAEVSEKIDEILYARKKFLDELVANNLLLLSQLDTAGATNDKADQALLGLRLVAKLTPLTADGSLRRQVRAVLPIEQLGRFDAILKEYWDAVISQEKKKDPKKPRLAIAVGERAQSLAREAEAAFKRLEKSGTLVFHYLFDSFDLTPAQRTELRIVLEEYAEETKGSPTKQQEAAMFFKLLSKLDVKQQVELVKKVRGK